MLEKAPDRILRKAILGMLSRTNLRHKYIEPRLKIYAGNEHPHTAQLPEGVKPLKKHPRARTGNHHFGLSGILGQDGTGFSYASPGVSQDGIKYK